MRFSSDTTYVNPGSRLHNLVLRIRHRLNGEEGFTLVELTMVLLILGILLSVAVPSYLSFKDRASKAAAKADLAQVIRSVAAYGADNYPGGANDPNADPTDSGYTGISLIWLNQKYDQSISTAPGAPFVMNPVGFTGTTSSFCLTATVGRWTAAQHGIDSPSTVGITFDGPNCAVS